MKETKTSFEVNGKVYPLVFNLNVMEAIQKEYGTVDTWTDLTDGDEYSKREYYKQNPNTNVDWDELKPEDKKKYYGEPDAEAVIFGFTEMINEGIDIENDERAEKEPFLTNKQVGRLITDYGLAKATRKLNATVIDSTKVESKNE